MVLTRFFVAILLLALGQSPGFANEQSKSCDVVWGVDTGEVTRAYRNNTDVREEALGFKTEDQVRRYIDCYQAQGKKEEIKLYHSDYDVMIQDAAIAYGIPESFLSCLFFRESSYWTGISSPKNAAGLTQIMPDAVKTLNYLIHKVDKKEEAKEEIKVRTELENLKQGPLNTNGVKRRVQYLESRLQVIALFRVARKGWQSYWSPETPPDHVSHDQLVMSSGLSKAEKLKRADLSIGLGSAFLKYYSLMLNTPEYDPDHWLITAGAYNMGAGGIKRFWTPPEVNSVLGKIKKSGIQETYNYINSIKSCSEKGNWDPMSGTNPRKCPQNE